ncbi:hypothetical protein GIX83_02240 [Lactobacillus reuteri]|uniref:Spore coat protein CotH n=1 Tax=Limosilactobacillus reuteri TaxID=1598 RepID=A0A6A8D1U0_LIMRT|nr:CotH kinase family protein [Limosilactobacillus reuteri]MRG68642.1 hypothetical protein [Limosilactobacillus reuteri]MRG68692.1 hypothetical protein [Limosilactobacillus reuteri]
MAKEISNLITFNTYKFERGGLLVDMFNQFNARVGDQGTELAIQWETSKTETKINLKERGLHFFGTGSVGQYLEKLEDGTGFKMSADASTVEWEDKDGAGSLDDGITIVKLPKQFFPQKGIFFGYFGLKDSLGNIFTSVNVWFRVLGGVPTMGAAIPYFVAEFDEVLERCNGKIVDALAELREKYQAEVKKNEDMSAETRAALEKLAASVGAIQAQIDAGDVVTRRDFTQQLNTVKDDTHNAIANVTSGAPKPIKDLATLNATYPNGTEGFFVTEDGHKYAYQDNSWKDFGIYQANGLSDEDASKLNTAYHHAIADGDPMNLIYNADLLTNNLTGWTCKDYPEAISFDDTNRYRGIASIKLTQSGLTESKYTYAESDQFKVVPNQPYVFNVSGSGLNTDSSLNTYSAQVFFADSQGKILDGTGTTNQEFQTDWNILSCSGMVPATAETAFVRLILRQNGTVFFSHPVFALRKTAPLTTDDLLPIIETKKSEAINDAHKFVTDNQIDIPQNSFPSSWMVADQRVSVQNSIITIDNSNGADTDYVSCFSNLMPVSSDRIFSGYSLKTQNCDGVNSYPFIQLYFYKSKDDAVANVNSISQQDWHWFTTTPGLYQQNPVVSENKWTDINGGSFAVPKGVNYVRIQYVLKGKGTVYFTNLSEYNKGVSPEKFSLPVLYLNGNLSTVTKDTIAKAAFSYKDGEVEKDGYLTIKWQGASSLNYPKKNWNIKLFSDDNFSEKMKVRMKADWANNNSYMLKADWIDATHARNLVNADLWKQLTLSRAVLRNNPVNYVQHSDMPYVDQMSGLDVKHTIYYLDKGFYGKTATVSFDLTTDSAGGDFHLVMSHQAHDLVTDNIQSGTHHYSQTITFDEDKHPDEVSRLSMIVNNYAGNFKLENMALVLGDKEIPDADNPVDSVTKLRKAPNAGTIQGFPILLVINGTPQGLYNFDSKKNNDLWNVDDKDPKNYVVISDAPDGTLATDNPQFGEGKYNFEVPDKPTDIMKNQFTALAKFINSSSDEEFKAQAADKVDLMAAVDQYLFNSYTTMIDAGAKSDVYITYNNGKYWIPSFYDFDSTWGLEADGSAIDDRYIMTWGASPTSSFMMSKLQIRVRDNFPELVKARWNELKDTIFNPAHITAMFENYISQIDQHYYELDQEIWPNIPSLKTTNRRQLQQFIADRWNVMNEFYANA